MHEALFLFVCQVGRQFHVVSYDEVAHCAVSSVVAFATQTYLCAVLCLGFNLKLDFRTVAQLDYHLAAKQRSIEVDVDVGGRLTAVRPYGAA